jgi:hypothetical protein
VGGVIKGEIIVVTVEIVDVSGGRSDVKGENS